MKSFRIAVPLTLILAVANGAAYAASTQDGVPAAGQAKPRFFIGADIGGGGDDLAKANYTNGDSNTIKAGDGVQFKLGLDYQFAPTMAVRASVGYHMARASGKNGDITFSRWPVEVLGFWKLNDKIRLGAGVRYASDAKLKGTGVASNIGTTTFDSNLGVVVEGEYLVSPGFGISLRAVQENFSFHGFDIKGDHFGVGLNGYF